MKSWIAFVIRKRRWVMAACLLFTLLLMSQMTRLKVIIDADNMLPQGNPYVQTEMEIERIFKNKFSVIVSLTAKEGSVYQAPILEKVQRITAGLMKSKGVVKANLVSLAARKAKSITGDKEGMTVKPLMEQVPRNEAEMAKLKAAIANNPAYDNLLISKDGRTTQIVAEFLEMPGGMSEIEASVREVVEPERDASVDIAVGGMVIFLAKLEQFSARMAFLLPLALLIIGLIHYEAFRTVQALALPLISAILAVIWSLALLAVSGLPIDAFNASTPILILAIAAGHAVQILKRYYEEFALLKQALPSGSPKELSEQAVLSALSKVGPVMIAACAVAALGFLSLTVFEIKAIRTFGIFAAAGVFSALIIELTFIPALRSALPAPGEREFQREKQISIWDRLVQKLYLWVSGSRKAVYAWTALVVVVLSLGGYWLKVENAQKAYFSGHLDVKEDDQKINERMAGTNTLYMMLDTGVEDGIKNPQVLTTMEKMQQHLEENPKVGKTISIGDFVKRMNQALHADQKEFYAIPVDQGLIAQSLLLYSNSGEPGDFDNYVDYGYRRGLIQVFYKTDNSIEMTNFVKDAEAYAKQVFPKEVVVGMGGSVVSALALNDEMVRGKILNILQILGCVFLVSSLLFRSLLAGILILIPLLATVFVNFGLMGLFGIPLNIATALVSAMAVGIGADYAIYLSFRMREELEASSSESEALRRAYMSAGKAAVFVSTAVAGGFGVLMLSWGFNIHFWMGLLIGLAMLVSSFSSLTLFAALVLSLRPKFIFVRERA